MELPLEIEEKILENTCPEDLISLCLSSKNYYLLSSRYNFWLRRVKRENLYSYLIRDVYNKYKEESTPFQYIRAYIKTISLPSIFDIPLERVPLEILEILELERGPVGSYYRDYTKVCSQRIKDLGTWITIRIGKKIIFNLVSQIVFYGEEIKQENLDEFLFRLAENNLLRYMTFPKDNSYVFTGINV